MEIRNPECFKRAKFFTLAHMHDTADRGSGRVLRVDNAEDGIHLEVNWFTRWIIYQVYDIFLNS